MLETLIILGILGYLIWAATPVYYLEGYMTRWHLIPRNRFFNIYLHKFSGDDPNPYCHDHPWWSFSWLIKGCMVETVETPVTLDPKSGDHTVEFRHRSKYKRDNVRGEFLRTIEKGDCVIRSPYLMHRLDLRDCDEAWTLFATGPTRRLWGFRHGKEWVQWDKFDQAQIGQRMQKHWSWLAWVKGESGWV